MIYYDLETTGLDPDSSRIVELAALDARRPEGSYVSRFDPGIPIPPGAVEVHGITNDHVADAPRFAEQAARVQRLFEGRRLCGYNIRSFDTPLLDAELRRAGQPGLDLEGVEEVDLYRVWSALEPEDRPGRRRLEDAVLRYLGRPMRETHAAEADVRILEELLEAIREAHGLGAEEMVELSAPPEELDRAGKLRLREGVAVFAFGKHEGEPVAEHPDYVDWMLRADFPEETKRTLRRLRERPGR